MLLYGGVQSLGESSAEANGRKLLLEFVALGLALLCAYLLDDIFGGDGYTVWVCSISNPV
jgi:hypothetical protein